MKRIILRSVLGLGCCAFLAADLAFSAPLLDQGFDQMYNLQFGEAHLSFEGWEAVHPNGPRGPVFDAAAYLFSEFDRLHILQSQFFVNDRSYSDLHKQVPSPELRKQFYDALGRGERLATARLASNPSDEDALFANVLRLGLESNYLALIEKQNLQALSKIKEATQLSESLLRIHPDCYDAYIAIGIENYLLSLKPAPVRWLLQIGGAQTDKQLGIDKLQLTATKGHFLKPYAELLLAVAALRNHNKAEARQYLTDLSEHFPRNQLYRTELQKIR